MTELEIYSIWFQMAHWNQGIRVSALDRRGQPPYLSNEEREPWCGGRDFLSQLRAVCHGFPQRQTSQLQRNQRSAPIWKAEDIGQSRIIFVLKHHWYFHLVRCLKYISVLSWMKPKGPAKLLSLACVDDSLCSVICHIGQYIDRLTVAATKLCIPVFIWSCWPPIGSWIFKTLSCSCRLWVVSPHPPPPTLTLKMSMFCTFLVQT